MVVWDYLFGRAYALQASIDHDTKPVTKSFSFFHGMCCHELQKSKILQ